MSEAGSSLRPALAMPWARDSRSMRARSSSMRTARSMDGERLVMAQSSPTARVLVLRVAHALEQFRVAAQLFQRGENGGGP